MFLLMLFLSLIWSSLHKLVHALIHLASSWYNSRPSLGVAPPPRALGATDLVRHVVESSAIIINPFPWSETFIQRLYIYLYEATTVTPLESSGFKSLLFFLQR